MLGKISSIYLNARRGQNKHHVTDMLSPHRLEVEAVSKTKIPSLDYMVAMEGITIDRITLWNRLGSLLPSFKD